MKNKKTAHFLVIFWLIVLAYSVGCKTTKNGSLDTGKNIPGGMSVGPSTFRCDGIVIESNSKSIKIKVSKMLEQGSSLFYSVSAGDTIHANFQSSNKTNYPSMQNVEVLIEERVMLNSEIPEFIVRQIQPN